MSVETALKKILGNRQSDLECPACAYQAPPKKAKGSIGKRNRGGVVVCCCCGHIYQDFGIGKNLTAAAKKRLPEHPLVDVIKEFQDNVVRNMIG